MNSEPLVGRLLVYELSEGDCGWRYCSARSARKGKPDCENACWESGYLSQVVVLCLGVNAYSGAVQYFFRFRQGSPGGEGDW